MRRKSGWVALVLVVVVVVLFKLYVVPQGAMRPTIKPGSRILVSRFSRTARRGDVMVFDWPKDRKYIYVMRVVALAGDVVAMRSGNLRVNDREIAHQAIPGACSYDEKEDDGTLKRYGCNVVEEDLDGKRYHVYRDPSEPSKDFPSTELPCPTGLETTATGCKVPVGHVFALGDNRDHSYDSRSWGAVPNDHLTGRSLF
jgi:signal peptidase I